MKRAFLVLVLILMTGRTALSADGLAEDKVEALALIKQFATTLKRELRSAMKEGGPAGAIGACRLSAPAIAAQLSSDRGWTVARTSLKVRNPANRPDAWERKVLEQFEVRKARGENVATLTHAEAVTKDGRKVLRFMKAVPTRKLCLRCHGTKLSPEVRAKLDALYPTDQARGFKEGDIRGAFSLFRPL